MPNRPLPSSRASDAAAVLPLFGLFLLLPPVITLFAVGIDLGGIPLIAVYVFGIWAALILCAGLLARRLNPGRTAPTPSEAAGEAPEQS